METIWFCLVALMLTAYVVLDGFDLGAGIVHLWVACTDRERRMVLRSIGPVWDGNEVWLLATGGTLYFAFPALYAAGFSGFYLPLMIVLWLLVLRGISIEFRNHLDSPVWQPLWDVVFSFSSLLLAVFFGAALGNVVRGVPIDHTGYFFEPLWTDFLVDGSRTGILDWYTILVGLAALAVLTLHGALWVTMKTEGEVSARSRQCARQAWWAVAALTVLVTWVTFRVQPHVPARLAEQPWGFVFPALALTGLGGMFVFLRGGNEVRAFLSSCAYIVGMLTSVAFGVYPYVLPSSVSPEYALTVHNAKAADYGLQVGLVWWAIGMALASGYFIYTYRHFAGKVRLDEEGY
ncbi:MAG: cytochrome d ubiquinol oxidase subunit II [Acidobacteria bacterium]|nr:cytochrome d ubiquinol oxidase subunit II [Acidobacteriota bacterium]